jgi:hypothetical protein
MNSENNKKMYVSKAKIKIKKWIKRRQKRLGILLKSERIPEERKAIYENEMILININLGKVVV